MTRRPYVYVDSPVVTAPRFATAVALVALAAALLDAEAQADGCAYAEDWVACVEAQREAAEGRMEDLRARQAADDAAREAAAADEDARRARKRAEDDGETNVRCSLGEC